MRGSRAFRQQILSVLRRLPTRGVEPASERLIDELTDLSERGDRAGLVRLLDRSPELAPRDQERVYRRFYRAFLELGEREQAAAALSRAAGPHNRDAGSVWREAKHGSVPTARAMLADRLGRFVEPSATDDWLAAFDVLYDASVPPTPTWSPHPALDDGFSRVIAGRWRFLSVSGMGWSGSGAVYDRLRDHRGAVAVAGESRLIEGRYGLANLPVGPDHHPIALHLNLRNLYRYNLLGLAPCKDWEDYRHVRNARRSSAGPKGDVIARTGLAALHELLAAAPDEQAATVARWSPMLLEAATLSQVGSTERVPILDNVVHVANLGTAGTFPDVLFFAVVRDPRDQFLDMLRSNRGYHGDPVRFANRNRKVRRVLDDVVAVGSGSVRVVSFERFVLDDDYREAMLADVIPHLGEPRSKKRRFDASISRQNIGLWRDTDRLDEIRAIEHALPEYLVD